MMKASEFMLLQTAREKRRKNQRLSSEEEAVFAKHGPEHQKMCSGPCGKPLGPRVDGEHHSIDGKEVCSDCYFDSFGNEIEMYPIGGHGVRRSSGPK